MEISTVRGEFCGRSRSWLSDGTLLSDDIYLRGKLVRADEYRQAAAKNKSLPRIAQTLEVDQAEVLSAWLNRYRDWFQENVLSCRWTEQRVVSNQSGYAGTADLLIEHRVRTCNILPIP